MSEVETLMQQLGDAAHAARAPLALASEAARNRALGAAAAAIRANRARILAANAVDMDAGHGARPVVRRCSTD